MLRITLLCKYLALLSLFFIPPIARAALVYKESFDYGASDGSLAGQSGGSGFSGVWTQQNPGILYSASGLTFSDLPVSGGAAYATGTDGIGNALLIRSLPSPLNGTYYGMFLSQTVVSNSVVVSGADCGISCGSAMNPFPIMNNYGILFPGPTGPLAIASGNAITSMNGNPPAQGQTYLTLFKIDSAAQTVNAWVLTAGQYDAFKAGGFTETVLNSADLGGADGQVWARAASTNTGLSSVVASNLSLFMNADSGVSASLAVDELRLSDTSFNEAINLAPPQPTLSITKSGNIFLLSWNTNFSGFALQQSSVPVSTNWTTLSGSPITTGDSYVYPIDLSSSSVFRLKK